MELYLEQLFKRAIRESWSTKCNIRSVGSMFVIKDAFGIENAVYFGHNGDEENPCIGKECRRDVYQNDDECPSPCAEGYCINKAIEDGKNLKDGVLVCTDLPCEKCIDLIEKYEIKDVYFWRLKKGMIRSIDWWRINWLRDAGVNLYMITNERALELESDLYRELEEKEILCRFPRKDSQKPQVFVDS